MDNSERINTQNRELPETEDLAFLPLEEEPLEPHLHELEQSPISTPAPPQINVRAVSSRAHLSLFLFSEVASLVVMILSILAMLFQSVLPEGIFEDPKSSAILSIVMSSISQYAIAFPLTILCFRLCFKNIPKITPDAKTRKFNPLDLLGLFAVLQLVATVGSLMGTILGDVLSEILGIGISDPLNDIVSSLPVWLIVLAVVIIGPIVEEILFRKLLFDRLAVLGELFAILLTSFAFGAFHGNIYQFFYATMAGLVFGYVYSRTRKLIYCIVLHSAFNFFGSVVSLEMYKISEKLTEALPNDPSSTLIYVFYNLILTLYSAIQFALMAGGFAILIYAFVKKKIQVSTKNPLGIENKHKILNPALCNAGVIIFYVSCLITTILNLFLA